MKQNPAAAQATLILRPGPRESIDGIDMTRNRMVVALYQNVKGGAYVYDYADGKWSRTQLDLPKNVSVHLGSAQDRDDRIFLNVTGYLDPTSLWMADAATGKVEKMKTSPARFDAAGLTVDQFEATSTDGTKVPYFVVHRANWKLDGTNPTLLYAYGGFQV